MDDLTLQEIRKGLEQQYRFKFYQDPKYPFLPAMGIKHIFQGFDAQEDGYVGSLHLWYTNEGVGKNIEDKVHERQLNYSDYICSCIVLFICTWYDN